MSKSEAFSMFRRHGRTSMRCPMVLMHEHLGYLSVTTRNVSASGVFVDTANLIEESWLPEMQVGDTLSTEIEGSNDQSESIQLRVVRKCGEGLGLTFISI